MRTKIIQSLLVLLLGFPAATAFSDVTYTYAGNTLQATDPWCAYDIYTAAPINFSITLSDDGLTISDWLFTHPDNFLTNLHQYGAWWLETDSSGQVTSWAFGTRSSPYDINNYVLMMTSGGPFESRPAGTYAPGIADPFPSDSFLSNDGSLITSGARIDRPGTWASTGTISDLQLYVPYNPDLPIPEPETYTMMGVGLALMVWVGRRKKSKEGTAA